jgi:hypothetical protein
MDLKMMLVQICLLGKGMSAFPTLEGCIFRMGSQVVVKFAWTAYKLVALVLVFAPVQPELV